MRTYFQRAAEIAVFFSLLIINNFGFGQTLTTDHFRSKTSGNWGMASSWESSHDSINWITATIAPAVQSSSVVIRTNHSITISSTITSMDQVKVSVGGTLIVGAALTIADGLGQDLIVYGKVQVNSTITANGSICIKSGGEYILKASAVTAVNACQWEDGSTLTISDVAGQPITGLNQNFYNFTWNGVTQSAMIVLDLTNDFHVRGNAIIQSTYGKDLVLNSISSRSYTIEGNLEIRNKSWLVLSTGSGSVDLTVNGNTIVGQDASAVARLELGKEGVVNNTLNINGNLTIGYVAGINKYGTNKNGKITFLNTSVPQSITNSGEINEVNYVLNPGVSVTANNFTVHSGYSLTIKDNASLILPTTSVVPATVERILTNADWSLPLDGWHLLSSPVANQELATGGFLSEPYDFYKWDEAENEWLNQKVGPNSITSFEDGRGYFVSYDNGATLAFSGNLHSASVPFSNLTVTGTSAYAGFHLLGNPFPCSLDWNAAGWALSNVSGVAQVWNEAAGNYLPLSADNGIIPPTQGFFVQAVSPVNSITIPTSARTHSNQAFYKNIPLNLLRLRITGAADSVYDETVIRLADDALNGFDLNDGHKLTGSENSPQLYTGIAPGEDLCVNAFPSSDSPETVPLYLNPGTDVSYMLEARVNTMLGDIYLEDLNTGVVTLLTEGTRIRVDASDTDDTRRFVLHMGPVGIAEQAVSAQQIYSYGKNVYFRECGNSAYCITDLAGQTVAAGTTGNGSLDQFAAGSLKPGIYLVTVYSSGKLPVTQKVFL